MATIEELERQVNAGRQELLSRTSPTAFADRLRNAIQLRYGKRSEELAGAKESTEAKLRSARQSLTADLSPEELANMNPAQQRALVQGQRAGLEATRSRIGEEQGRLERDIEVGANMALNVESEIQKNLLTRLEFLNNDLASAKQKKAEQRELAFGLANMGIAITPQIEEMLNSALTKDEKAIWLSTNATALRRHEEDLALKRAAIGPRNRQTEKILKTDANGNKYEAIIDVLTGQEIANGAPLSREVPSFEDFKLEQLGNFVGPLSPKQEQQLRRDYDAMIGQVAEADTLANAFNFAASGLPSQRQEASRKTFNSYLQSGDVQSAANFVLKTARDGASADQAAQAIGREQTIAALTEVSSLLNQVGSGKLKGSLEKGFQIVGATRDAKLADIENRIRVAMQTYRKATSGVSFTPQEAREYAKIFPDIDKSVTLNNVKIESLLDVYRTNQDIFYQQQLGDAYQTIKLLRQGGQLQASGIDFSKYYEQP